MLSAAPSRAHKFIATVVGVALVVALVTASSALFMSGKDFWFVAIAGNLLTVPIAVSAWHGDIFGKGGGPRTPREWLWFFAASSVLSAVFVAIDVLLVHPGLGALFTLGALAMAFIALPGAARAWVLEFLATRQRNG